MAKTYTEEQLNTFDKATLIQLLLMQQSQLQEIDKKLQLLLEQAAVLKNNRFGKKSEKLGIENQVCFMEVDGDIVFFNEAEAVNALVPEDEEKSTKPKNAKTKGKRTADIKDLPVIHVDHKMTESELITEFGEDGWYQLEDEIYRRYRASVVGHRFSGCDLDARASRRGVRAGTFLRPSADARYERVFGAGHHPCA